MRRVAVHWLVAFACGIALQSAVHFRLLHLVLAALAVLVMSLSDRFRLPGSGSGFFTIVLVVLVGALRMLAAEAVADPFAGLEGRLVIVEGWAGKVAVKDPRFARVEVEADTIRTASDTGHEPYQAQVRPEKILVEIAGDPAAFTSDDAGYALLPGRRICIAGIVTIPPGAKNPKGFDYRIHLRTHGIRTVLKARSWQCTLPAQEPKQAQASLQHYRNGFLTRLGEATGAHYGLMAGILLGDKTSIDSGCYRDFQENGVAHILSVSGLHVGIVFLCVRRVVGSGRGLPARMAAGFLLLVYAALSEFSPSVVRAVLMIFVCMAADVLHERYDLTCSCAVTALILLAVEPFSLFGLGFQLSFLAVFSLAVLLPFIERQYCRVFIGDRISGAGASRAEAFHDAIRRCFAPIVAIQLGMIPVTACFFNYFSLSAFWVNIPVILLASVALPIGLCMMVLSLLPAWPIAVVVFDLLGAAAGLVIQAMVEINRFAADQPWSSITAVSPPPAVMAGFYAALFFFVSETGQWLLSVLTSKLAANAISDAGLDVSAAKKANKAIAAALAVWMVLAAALPPDRFRDADVIFLDVGQGDCLHVRTPAGKNILIDSGGSAAKQAADPADAFDIGRDVLRPYLLKNGADHIDMAFVTHLHDDHFQGLCSLSQTMRIEEVYLYEGNRERISEIRDKLRIQSDSLRFINAGMRIEIEPGVSLSVLFPDDGRTSAGLDDENAINMVMLLDYCGRSILITGDLTVNDEKRLLGTGSIGKADILKIAHHGSRYSSSEPFIDAVDPDYAVIQVGRNNFGHPSDEVIAKLKKKGIISMRTDLDHAVLFDIDPGKPSRVMTMETGRWHAY